ncbi:MAG: hypothetical protein WCI73_05530 [Phycisphaerae bacterium]
MDMADIAKRAAAAHEALAALAQAVRDLPEPKFKFDRSVGLLAALSSWAERNRPDTGFSEATVISGALEAGLDNGCKARGIVVKRGGKEPRAENKVGETPGPKLAAVNAVGGGSINMTDIAKVLGRAGGKSQSEKKVAAARANIQKINLMKRRLASRSRKRMKRRN